MAFASLRVVTYPAVCVQWFSITGKICPIGGQQTDCFNPKPEGALATVPTNKGNRSRLMPIAGIWGHFPGMFDAVQGGNVR